MGFRERISIFAAFAFLGAAASAATVSMILFESGMRDGTPKAEASSAWENGVMDALFEDGNIVSNADSVRLAKPGLPSSSYGLAEARLGGAEYVVQISLDYDTETPLLRPSPGRVAYRVCDERGETLLQNEECDLLPTKNGAEDERNAHEVARILIGRMKKDR